jgi:chitin-binding protein
MTAVRRTGALAAAAALAALTVAGPAGPAGAHGATTRPVSRTAACAQDGDEAGSAACRAARAANGGPFGSFDNLRVAGVGGRDRAVIPDGRLCSAGRPEFAGLDLARDDWPATRLTAGQALAIRYAGTIPHRGTFRVYLTRPGYDPEQPLGWSDLDAEPFLTVTDPPLRDGAYRMRGKLPAGRTGRHLMYVVWQNSTTPDTYYSCSDLIITGPARAAGAATGTTAAGRAIPSPAAGDAGPDPAGDARLDPVAGGSPLRPAAGDTRVAPGRYVTGAALIVAAGLAAGLAVRRIRRAGSRPMHRAGKG